MQLSARDLEKQTEKELEKWRKDRPSSTFDPRGRCHGYRMAWARARQNEEVWGRKENEKGNMSAPLARSASTLSLSPSLLHKRWRKGGKANSREWKGSGAKVVRHLSMGAKEDWRGWTEFSFKKVQCVQEEEDLVLEDHKKESELKLLEEVEQIKLLEEPKTMEILNMPTMHVEEQIEQVETRMTEKEESQLNNSEESRVLSEQKEETIEETQPTKDQTVEHKEGDELDSNSQTEVQEQQSHKIKHVEIQGKDSNKETENQVSERENTNAVVENQTEKKENDNAAKNTKMETQESVYPREDLMIQVDMEPEESTETVQQTQVDTDTTDTSPGSETDGRVKAPTIKDPTTETQQQEVITETDRSSRGDEFEEKYLSSESLAETETQEESHTQTETETNELAQTQEKVEGNAATQESESEIIQMNSDHIDSETGAETFILCSPQCIQPEGADLEAETYAKIPFANDIVTESSAAIGKECDASEATHGEEERSLDEHSEAQVNQTQAEETEMETNLIAPPQKEEDITQDARTQAGPDGKTSSVETEESAAEKPTAQVTIGVVEEGCKKKIQENTGEDTVFISTEPTDCLNTDRNPEVQDKDSCHVTAQAEPVNSALTQAPRQRSSRSSGDFGVRRSSNSRGSRFTRRLSEDLFIMSEKTSQSQSTPSHQEVNHNQLQPNPGAVHPTQSPSDVTSEVSSSSSAGATPAVHPPKRFGLFGRLRGEKAKKATKMQIPKILIQDYSDGTGKPVEEEGEDKLSSKERRRRRRDRERKEKEEERLKKKREKELEKEKERERRKAQTRGQSFYVQREKGRSDVTQPAQTGSQTLRDSSSSGESYF